MKKNPLTFALERSSAAHLRDVRVGGRPLAHPHHRQLSPDTAEEERLPCLLASCDSSARENQQLKDVDEPGKGVLIRPAFQQQITLY